MRDHSSMRRAPSMSSDSVEIADARVGGTSATARSSNEKKPSCHDISSNTTLSICEAELPLELALRDRAGAHEAIAESARAARSLERAARAARGPRR